MTGLTFSVDVLTICETGGGIFEKSSASAILSVNQSKGWRPHSAGARVLRHFAKKIENGLVLALTFSGLFGVSIMYSMMTDRVVCQESCSCEERMLGVKIRFLGGHNFFFCPCLALSKKKKGNFFDFLVKMIFGENEPNRQNCFFSPSLYTIIKYVNQRYARSPPSMVGVIVLNDFFAELQRVFFRRSPSSVELCILA